MTVSSVERRQWIAGVLALPLAAAVNQVFAETGKWPTKPLRVILGYPPGGGADGVARAIERGLAGALGQPIVFDYKPGAGATIAAESAARVPADGYVLHLMDAGPATILPNGKKVNYDPFTDFTYIGLAADGGTLLVSHPDVPVKSLADLIALAKRKPGELSYGTSGIGGGGHLAAELLQASTGIQLVHVPYKGGAQASTDLQGGQIPLLFSSMPTAVPYVKSGKMRPLATTSLNRASTLPDVPTVAEQGYPGFEATIWYGLVGPKGVPRPIVDAVNQALKVALADANVQKLLSEQGYEAAYTTPEGFEKRLRGDSEKWGKVIRDAKIAFP